MGKLACQVSLEGPGLSMRVVRFDWHEALSQLFAGDVLFESDNADLELTSLLWTAAHVRLSDGEQLVRCFSGVIDSASYAGEQRHGVFHYRLRLRPQIHALGQRVRSRIFQAQDVKEIVSLVCKGAGLPEDHLEWQTDYAGYPKREYCTQFKESELAFVLRLLAEEGIFFWFEHDELGHRIHFADGPGVHIAIDPDTLHCDHAKAVSRQLATELRFRTQLVQDACVLRDWDWLSPAKPLEAAQSDAGAKGLVHYGYPGGFSNPADGGRHASDHLRAQAVKQYTLSGRSNHLGIAPGRLLAIEGARPGSLNRGYLVLSCVHRYDERHGVADAEDRNFGFSTRFVATHDDVEFRPLPLPKPRATGVESAVITSAGDEIHVDEWGRVKVHLHWDREGQLDDTATCFIRVQQPNLSGSMYLPRLGWEVAVGFVDGDPDRPLILQKLYNRETMPPYELPANLSQSSLQSASSPGGGGTNELRLQDSAGAQGFAMHAQRDFALSVGNDSHIKVAVDSEQAYNSTLDVVVGIDESTKVGGSQHLTMKANLASHIGGNKTLQVGALEDWNVKAIYSTTVNGNRSETIGAAQQVQAVSMAETFNANHTQTVGAAMALTTADSLSESVVGNKSLQIGGAYVIKTTGSYGEFAGKAKLLKAGATTYDAKGGFSLAAKAGLLMQIGGALAERVKGNVAISGKKLKVEAPDGATIKGGGTKFNMEGGKLELKASSFGAKGGPMLTVKGKIVFK